MSYQNNAKEDVLLVTDDVLNDYVKQRIYECVIPAAFKLSSKKEKDIAPKLLSEFEKDF